VDDSNPFIAYRRESDNLVVFGFRGFSSGAETAIHVQLVAQHFILPFVTALPPLYDLITSNFLSWWMQQVHQLSESWVNPIPPVQVFMNTISEIVESVNASEFLFTGINVGGLFAKALGMKYQTNGISFLSYPIIDDMLGPLFGVDDNNALYVTNVHTFDGVFTGQEPEKATNYGIPWIGASFLKNLENVSGLADVNVGTSIRDSVYRTFCILSEMCGRGDQFGPYCENAIGGQDLLFIRTALQDQYGMTNS
jgi:hypothetical protein